MTGGGDMKAVFVELSSALTDYDAFTLYGTGQVDAYWQTLLSIVGESQVTELLDTFQQIVTEVGPDEQAVIDRLRRDLLGSPSLGPVARNLIKLWYTGKWYQLPLYWRQRYGERPGDAPHFVSAAAYTEGLLWKAIDAPPSGAKGPGFGSWQVPPKIDFDHGWTLKPKRNSQ